MRYLLCTVFAVFAVLAVSHAYADMQADIDRATTIVNEFKMMPEQGIPPSVLEDAKGLVIITIGKAGFVLSGRGGGGVIMVKTPANAWSAPSSVIVGGAGLGLQIGAQITDFVLVLNSQDAVNAFLKGGNVTIGGDLSASAGPVGRTAEAGIGSTAIYSYSRSAGLFAGVSLEGTVLAEGTKTNELFYGRPITPKEILSGAVPPPASASALYQALSTAVVPKAEPAAPAAKPATPAVQPVKK